jgi:hypothetical protein
MAQRYIVRAKLRTIDNTLEAQVLNFRCWRLRLYVLAPGTNTVLNGIPLVDLAGPVGNSLEFGGVVLGTVPVMYEQTLTFVSAVYAKSAVLIVEEYLEPVNA